MVDIYFYRNGFILKGHANFSSKGNDIVCSAICGVIFGFLNWLNELDYTKVEDDKIPLLKVVLKLNEKIIISFDLIKIQIASIYKSYKKNINLNFINIDL